MVTSYPSQRKVTVMEVHSPLGARVGDLSWLEVEARINGGAVALLPVGAGSKQHGLHLPMASDCLQAQWLAERVAMLANVLIWPTLAYGYYPAFVEYPGSVSLRRETFQALAQEILAELLRWGARRIVVLNTGVSTIEPLRGAIRGVDVDARVRLANVYQGPHYLAAVAETREQPRGGHADEAETSIMLVVAPEKVAMRLARPCCDRPMTPGRLRRRDPTAANFSPDGVYGNPSLATQAKGERLARAIIEDLLEAVGGGTE